SALEQLLELRVGGIDGAPRGGVARLALRRLVLGGPRARVGELVLELAQRRLGLLDRALGALLLAQPVLARPARRRRRRRGGRRGLGRGRALRPGGPARRSRLAVLARGSALLADAHVLGPAADIAAQRALLDGDRP